MLGIREIEMDIDATILNIETICCIRPNHVLSRLYYLTNHN